ncbi:hypothetical protein B0I37DRAFT_349099 [Chaetomium sp. MPI-CAGE-AT-0009]|nr:hypothetical protein B0I37DRAFT_349099 [Chaetomium sp. MPI-CAGE-AT-0009]
MEYPHTYTRQKPRSEAFRDAAKIAACGIMVGSALVFPLANTEASWFRAVFGRFTAPVALTLLLVAVLAIGPSRTDLIPWLPLFAVVLSLITVVIHDISQHVGDAECEFSGVSIDTESNRSLRTISTQPRAPVPLESNRHNSLYFDRHGPPSTTSLQTWTDGTEITLTGVVGQRREHWDDQTQSYFPGTFLPDQEHTEELHARLAIPEGSENPDVDSNLDSDLDSNHGTVESDQPLLGPQGGRLC